MRPIDRRSFLALGVGAVAWACSRGGDEDEDEAVDPAGAISIVATGLQLAVGDSRQAFAVLRGQRPYVPDELSVRLTPPGGKAARVEVDRQRIKFGRGGEDDASGAEVTDIFSFRHDFERPGIWVVNVTADGKRSQAAFQVLAPDDTEAPRVGDRAIASKSPTTDDARGVDPICSRNPRCAMHDVSLADALGAGKPTVVVFGTPRFCTSRTCGPVVDIVETQKERVGDSCSFVHVEVWKDDGPSVNKPGGEAPAFAEWKLGTEPWIYFIGADGVVRDRWLGAIGRDEIRLGVDALVSE